MSELTNTRLDVVAPLVKSAELLSEMARQFAEQGDYEMAMSLMKTTSEVMATAQTLLGDK